MVWIRVAHVKQQHHLKYVAGLLDWPNWDPDHSSVMEPSLDNEPRSSEGLISLGLDKSQDEYARIKEGMKMLRVINIHPNLPNIHPKSLKIERAHI